MKQKLQALLVIIFVAISAFFVSATEPGEASITDELDLGEYLQEVADTVDLEAGNIEQANVNTQMSTYRWAGLLGNVSGNIVLGDDDENELFSWVGAGRIVYASTSAAVSWDDLADATVAEMPAYLTGGDSDDYTTTFAGGVENIGSGIFSTVTSDHALTFRDTGAGTWKTYSLWDTTNLVWAGLVSENGLSYKNTTVDYQMIIPEDGEDGDTTPETFNLWIELV